MMMMLQPIRFRNPSALKLAMALPTVIFGLMLSCLTLNAQPSDAEVIKDITGPKTIAVTLSKTSKGTRQWNSDTKAYEWVRGAVCSLRTEDPKVTLLVTGDAVYNLIGAKATYRKFRVISNEYLGLPKPSLDTLMAIIKSDLSHFFGSATWNNMVGEIEQLDIVDESSGKWKWHTFNSVEFPVMTKFNVISSYTTVDHKESTYFVRIYRDDVDAPWKSVFVSTPREENVLGTTKYTDAEMKALPRTSSLSNDH